MNWKTLWKKYHNDRVQWVSHKDHPSEGIDTIRCFLSRLEIGLVTTEEVADWFRHKTRQVYIKRAGLDLLYTTFADEVEQVKFPPLCPCYSDDDPIAELKHALLQLESKHLGACDDAAIIDLQFLLGKFTQSHLRPSRFVFAIYSAGTWMDERDDQNTDSTAGSRNFRSWMNSTRGSERHFFIVDIPQSGFVFNEVEAWQAYRFLACDPGMSKDEAERWLTR